MDNQGSPYKPRHSWTTYSQRETYFLYLRGVIQNALLTPRDGSGIKEEDMDSTSTNLSRLEYVSRILEASILKTTKLHKVMKAITKLDPARIPREEEYRFVDRARALLALYTGILAEDAEGRETGVSRVPDDGDREQTGVYKTVDEGQSADDWVWIDNSGEEMGIFQRPIPPHPCWNTDEAGRLPECGDMTREEYETVLWKF